MVKNTVQFQGGLSLPRSPVTCGTEAQRRLALFTMLRPQGCHHRSKTDPYARINLTHPKLSVFKNWAGFRRLPTMSRR